MISFRRKASVLLGDLLLVSALVLGVTWVLGVRDPLAPLLLIVTLPASFYVSGLYELERGGFRSRPLIQIVVACAITGVVVATLDFLFSPLVVSRRLLVGSLGLVALSLGPWRLLLEHLETVRGRRRVPLVLMGHNGRTAEVVDLLEGHALFDLRDTIAGPLDPACWNRILGPLARTAAANGATFQGTPPTLVVAESEHLPGSTYSTLLDLRRSGVRVLDFPRFWEEATGRLPVQDLSDEWLALHSGILPGKRGLVARLKRIVDVAGALVLLGVLAVPTALAAVALWLNDPGPVLFRQRRVGQDGRPFEILKLRTMKRRTGGSGPQWTVEGDERVTRVGRWVRRSRLDEVPQLVNVLKGEMSLVGPRPEAAELSTMYQESIRHYTLRHLAKPGVTGWAQVCFRNTCSLEDARRKLEYDLYYVHHMGPVLDARILLKTVYVVLFGRGGR